MVGGKLDENEEVEFNFNKKKFFMLSNVRFYQLI